MKDRINTQIMVLLLQKAEWALKNMGELVDMAFDGSIEQLLPENKPTVVGIFDPICIPTPGCVTVDGVHGIKSLLGFDPRIAHFTFTDAETAKGGGVDLDGNEITDEKMASMIEAFRAKIGGGHRTLWYVSQPLDTRPINGFASALCGKKIRGLAIYAGE